MFECSQVRHWIVKTIFRGNRDKALTRNPRTAATEAFPSQPEHRLKQICAGEPDKSMPVRPCNAALRQPIRSLYFRESTPVRPSIVLHATMNISNFKACFPPKKLKQCFAKSGPNIDTHTCGGWCLNIPAAPKSGPKIDCRSPTMYGRFTGTGPLFSSVRDPSHHGKGGRKNAFVYTLTATLDEARKYRTLNRPEGEPDTRSFQ